MEPVDTSDVPRAIAVVRDFVNTTDRETGTDDLVDARRSSRVPRRPGPDGARVQGHRRRTSSAALRLRSGLRRALELNHDGQGATLPELADSLGDHPVALTWTPEGPVLTTTAPGVPGAWPGSRSPCTRRRPRASGGG